MLCVCVVYVTVVLYVLHSFVLIFHLDVRCCTIYILFVAASIRINRNINITRVSFILYDMVWYCMLHNIPIIVYCIVLYLSPSTPTSTPTSSRLP